MKRTGILFFFPNKDEVENKRSFMNLGLLTVG
jgi:hypothetical protein